MGIYREFDAHKQPLKYKRCFCDVFLPFPALSKFWCSCFSLAKKSRWFNNKMAKIHLYRWKQLLKSGKFPSIKVMTFSCILWEKGEFLTCLVFPNSDKHLIKNTDWEQSKANATYLVRVRYTSWAIYQLAPIPVLPGQQ